MSAQHYWNSGQDNSYQSSQGQSNHDGYSASYNHNQPHQPQGYSQDNEPMNWGYGGANQQEPLPPQTHDYYNTQTSDQYSSQTYTSYDSNYDSTQGYHQSYQNYSQPEQSYQSHSPYVDPSHSPQPPPYGSDTRDYNQPYTTNEYNTIPYQDQGYPPQTYSGIPGQADGERGILGAIGGAAAGGFAGHKVNHGFIGAVGGAYAGHKLEEAMKDKKKKEKKGKHHGGHGSSSSSSSSSSDDDKKKKHKKYGAATAVAGGAAAYGHHQHHQHHHQHHHGGSNNHKGATAAGNFSATSTQISLDRDYDLIASCATLDHTHRLSSISLNDCLANEWGHLRWVANGGFGGSARNVRLIDGGRGLEAELGDGKGGWNVSRILLDERISNNNGDLQFLR